MSAVFRVIDTGVREGRANIAFDAALIELHKAGAIPDTIRFLQFRPTALVGRHQALSQELRLDYCARERHRARAPHHRRRRALHGRGTVRLRTRVSPRDARPRRLSANSRAQSARRPRRACKSSASTRATGRATTSRSTAARSAAPAASSTATRLFYQGTMLVDMDAERMLAALNVPRAKLAKRGLDSADRRVVTLARIAAARRRRASAQVKAALLEGFAERLGIAPRWGEIDAHEETLARTMASDEEIGTEEFSCARSTLRRQGASVAERRACTAPAAPITRLCALRRRRARPLPRSA